MNYELETIFTDKTGSTDRGLKMTELINWSGSATFDQSSAVFELVPFLTIIGHFELSISATFEPKPSTTFENF